MADRNVRLLGWYMRNCAISPAAEKLEGTLLHQFDKMKLSVEEDEFDASV